MKIFKRRKRVAPSSPTRDDSQIRLQKAKQLSRESAALLNQTRQHGVALSSHIERQRRLRVENGFVAVILDNITGR